MTIRIMLIALLFSTVAIAQDSKEYRKMAEEIEQSIFSTKDPMFESNTVPAEFKNESAIILAQKHTVETDSKKKFKFYGLGFAAGVQGTVIKTLREKIYINDQAALDEYSQLSFSKLQSKRSGILGKNIAYSFLGLHVIKPDGTVQKIDIDESKVTVKETKDGTANKIAIPGLSIGDIVDYYITSYDKTDGSTGTGGSENMMFVLADDYPIVQFNINILFDKRIAAEYQCINGAPMFKISPDGDDNRMEMIAKNLPKLKNLMWNSVARQIPLTRVKYAFGEISHRGGNKVKKGEVAKMFGGDDIETGLINDFASYLISIGANDNIKGDWKKFSANKRNMNNDSLAAYIYYYYRYYTFTNFKSLTGDYTDVDDYTDDLTQLKTILAILNTVDTDFDITGEVFLVTGRSSVKRADLFSAADLSFILKLNTPKPQYLYLGSALYNFGEVPPSFEGETGRYASYKAKKSPIMRRIYAYTLDNDGTAKIPASAVKDNIRTETITVELDKANPQLLNLKRNVLAKGHLRRDLQSELMLTEDMMLTERTYLGLETDLRKAWIEKGKEFKKSVDEFSTVLANARKEEKKKYENEISGQFDSKPKELKSYKILNYGLRHTDPGFNMEEEFTMDGWIKKAGNNYILEAGKLFGSQLEIKADQRERKLDVYMPFPRAFNYAVEFIIPDGYTAEGVEKLNKKVENETGGFVSTAKIEGNKIVVTARKYYNNNFEPVANWTKLVAFVDEAFNFGKEKILLKKK